MRVLFLIQDEALPSSRVRVVNLVPQLRRHGIEPTVCLYPRALGDKVRVFRECRKSDVVVLQKKLPSLPETFLLKAACRRLVYDFDDAVYLRDDAHEKARSTARRMKFRAVARAADLVIAGNNVLADAARAVNRNVVTVPSAVETCGVPTRNHADPSPQPVIGWIGGEGNLRHLALLEPVLQRLLRRHRFELRVICSKALPMAGVRTRFVPWALETQEREIAQFDVGLMPLPPSPFAAGKCGYKALQYMAAGVPPVVSDVGDNRHIVAHGSEGYVVKEIDDFYPALECLLHDAGRRANMGGQARRHVEEEFSVQVVAKRLAEALERSFAPVAHQSLAFADTGQRAPARIALVRQKYRVDGGAERFVSRLASVLGGGDCRVTVIARRWHGDGDAEILPCNPPSLGRTLREWTFARGVRRLVRKHRFDVVQSNERIPGCDVYRAGDGVHREWLRQRRRVQSALARLATVLSPFHAYVKRAERRLFESPQLRAVICNSQMVRHEILDHFAVDPEKLRVVYNGVDTEKFHPALKQQRRTVRKELGVPEDETVFLFVGSGFERKGLDAALEAVARLPRGRLVVVGKDKHAGRYRRLAERLNILGRVHFLGVKPGVGPYYGAADVLVLPTLYDPFPNVVLEAMAAGLPVVTSTKCGGAELIREGQNGYVCDALDRERLAAAMQRLLDPGRARRLGDEARRSVEPYTLAATRANLTRLYEELLDDRR